MPQFQTDSSGNVITKTVTGWTVAPAAGVAVVAAIQFAETAEELERGKNESIQLGLTPSQCLDLADALTRAARHLLKARSARTPLQ